MPPRTPRHRSNGDPTLHQFPTVIKIGQQFNDVQFRFTMRGQNLKVGVAWRRRVLSCFGRSADVVQPEMPQFDVFLRFVSL